VQKQALQSAIGDRWHLVQALLRSIQKETVVLNPPTLDITPPAGLEPWAQSLIGALKSGQPFDPGKLLPAA
jgi:hypothetical protein